MVTGASWKQQPIDEGEYSKGRPRLTVDHLEGQTATVVTIDTVEQFEFDDPDAPDGRAKRLGFYSTEFPGLVYYLNLTGIRALAAHYGETPVRWEKKRVPLVSVRVSNPKNQGKLQPALHVAQGDEWDEVLALFDQKPRRGRSASKTGAKRERTVK